MNKEVILEICEKYKTGKVSIRQLAKLYDSKYETVRLLLKGQLKENYDNYSVLSNENSIALSKSLKQKKYCCNCNKLLENNSNKFCSRSCGAIYNNSIKHPEENRVKRVPRGPKHEPEVRLCKACNSEFIVYKGKHKRVTCSPECAHTNSIKHIKANIKYNHKDGYVVSLDSSWELRLAKWLDENNIEWTRPKYIPWIDKSGKNRKYFPDFYIPKLNVYLDPKNAHQIETTKDKLDYICQRHTLFYGSVENIIKDLSNVQKTSFILERNISTKSVS